MKRKKGFAMLLLLVLACALLAMPALAADVADAPLTIEDQQRIAKGMTAIRNAQAAENAYEASKYE